MISGSGADDFDSGGGEVDEGALSGVAVEASGGVDGGNGDDAVECGGIAGLSVCAVVARGRDDGRAAMDRGFDAKLQQAVFAPAADALVDDIDAPPRGLVKSLDKL